LDVFGDYPGHCDRRGGNSDWHFDLDFAAASGYTDLITARTADIFYEIPRPDEFYKPSRCQLFESSRRTPFQ
jgi:hypothetical protein